MTATPPAGSEGEVITVGDETILRFERHLEFPVSEVWDAITDPERLGRWLFPTTFEKRPGGTLRIDLGDHGTAMGRVLLWDEPHVLEYEWREPPGVGDTPAEVWHIRFTLSSEGEETVMVFEHLLPDSRRPEFAAGWHWYLNRLTALLRGNPPADVETDDEFDLLLANYLKAASDG